MFTLPSSLFLQQPSAAAWALSLASGCSQCSSLLCRYVGCDGKPLVPNYTAAAAAWARPVLVQSTAGAWGLCLQETRLQDLRTRMSIPFDSENPDHMVRHTPTMLSSRCPL